MTDVSEEHGSPLARLQRGRDRDSPCDPSLPSAPSRRRFNGSTPQSMSIWSRISCASSLDASVRTLDSTPSQQPPALHLGFDRGAEVEQPVVALRRHGDTLDGDTDDFSRKVALFKVRRARAHFL